MTKSSFGAVLRAKTFVIGAIVAGCAAPGDPGGVADETQATEQAISNGNVATSNSIGIVDLWIYPSYQCTGTLLNSRWVLTAAHCLLNAAGTGLVPASYVTASNALTVTGSSPYVTGDAVFQHPSLDIVLVHLSSTLAGTDSVTNVLGLQKAQDLKGKTVTCYGYGYDTHFKSSGWGNDNILRYANTQKVTSDSGILENYGAGNGIWMVLDVGPGNHQGEWEGDSGGPCFYTDANNNRYLVMVFTNWFYNIPNDWAPYDSLGPSSIGFRDWVWYWMFTADIALAGGGGYTLGPSIAAPDANHLQAFVPWTDTAIYEYTRTNGSWSSYFGPFSSGFTSAPASCGYAANMSLVFARKADNALWYAHAKTDGTIVGSWTSLGSPPGYVFQGSPAAVNTNGYSYVFGRGTDNQLWYRRSNDSGRTNWGTAWTAVGGKNKLYSDPSAASYASGWVHVFGLSSSSSLQYVVYNNSSWSAWTSPADTSGPYHYPPVVTSSGPNQLDLFMRGYSDNVIHYRKYYGSMGLAPNWTSLDYVTSSNPAVASRATGVMDLVFLGPNADVHFAESGD